MGLGGGGSSGGDTKAPPIPIAPVDLLRTELAGLQADQFGYDLSDKDFANRFPGLVAARNADIQKAYQEVTGPLAPEVESDFTEKGLAQAFSAFGAGQDAPMVTGKGTIGRNTVAASVANNTLSYQDAARQYFESLLAQNPERAFGLTGGDLLNLSILNQSNLNNAITQERSNQSALDAANAAAGNAKSNALLGAGSSILSAGIGAIASAG